MAAFVEAAVQADNGRMAAHVDAFRDNQTTPPPAEEGAVLVVSADGKGSVLRRVPDAPAHRNRLNAWSARPWQRPTRHG